MEVSRSRKGKADVAGNCSSAFLLFRAFKLCYNKNGNSRKKKMRPVGFMMREYRNYERIFNGNKAELASAPQSVLAPQCLCGFSRLVLQDFRPARGLILLDNLPFTGTLLVWACKTFAPPGDWYISEQFFFTAFIPHLARLSPRQGTDTLSWFRPNSCTAVRRLARLSPRQGTDTRHWLLSQGLQRRLARLSPCQGTIQAGRPSGRPLRIELAKFCPVREWRTGKGLLHSDYSLCNSPFWLCDPWIYFRTFARFLVSSMWHYAV